MPLIHPLINPCLERLSNDGIDDIGYIASRQLLTLSLDHRQDCHDILMLSGILQHCFECQALEVWDGDVLYICLLDPCSLSRYHVPHMENRHGLIAAEIEATIMCQESVNLSL